MLLSLLLSSTQSKEEKTRTKAVILRILIEFIDILAYINHPIGVAHTLLTLGELKPSQHDLAILSPEEWRRISKDKTRPLKPLAAVLAAILHDTIEDTDTTFEELESLFGHVVASIVIECTDDKSLVKEERKQKQVDTAPFKSMEAKCVKLADKLYNLRDLIRCVPEGWTKERVQEYFSWAKRVINGCRGVLPKVEAELDNLFEHGTFKYQGQTFKCIP